ncbi:hypothetical protein J1N35_004505 [Gossypium stocksii]|uniref:Uncharacterized protein n=1 Tax=Gossypium stocksii TaxID=47602 RepID=A0A9D3WDN6_9ROSI|nr:hypothetical protein J1N35_004505 [Gossypium stocksii]
MLKEVDEQIETMQTHGRARKVSRSRDMLSALDGRVAKLVGPIGNVKETLKEVNRRTRELELRHDQLKDQMAEALSENMDMMQGVLNTVVGELIEKEDVADAIVSTLKEHFEELKGELNICKAALGNRVLLRHLCLKSIDERRDGTAIETKEEFHREFKDYPERSNISITNKEEVDPIESKVLKLGSMILNSTKIKRDNNQKRLMYVDINIADQRKSALTDTGASNLLLENVMCKLGVLVCESTKKIKIF